MTAAAAQALPGGDLEPETCGSVLAGCDTDYTPVAKPTDLWKQVAGARFARTEVIPDSPTAYDSDLFAVSFRNTRIGLAGGSKCREAIAKPEDTATCERVPVVYRYVRKPNGERGWSQSYLGSSRGYVAAIAWITATKAVAVGGDGTYPRRELAREAGESYADWVARDRAAGSGGGRAWLYQNGSWSEIDLSAQRLQGMTALTAIDFRRTGQPALGFAGGLGQIWEWNGDGFTRKWDASMPEEAFHNRKLFRYRVRQLRFMPDGPKGEVRAGAVTAGCCGGGTSANTPRIVQYRSLHPDGQRVSDASGNPFPSRWAVVDDTDEADPERTRREVNDTGRSADTARCGGANSLGVSHQSCLTPGRAGASLRDGVALEAGGRECVGETRIGTTRVNPAACAPLPSLSASTLPGSGQPSRVEAGGRHCQPDAGAGEVCADVPRQEVERDTGVLGPVQVGDTIDGPAGAGVPVDDSVYPARDVKADPHLPDSIYGFQFGQYAVGMILRSPGGPEQPDEAASVFERVDTTVDTETRVRVGTTRLVAMDGDWSVGELRSTHVDGLGSQGIVFDPFRPSATPDTVTLPGAPSTEGAPYADYEPTDPDRIERFHRSGHYRASSYALNAIDMIEDSSFGWAVGDHGAILTVDEQEVEKFRPEPPVPDFGDPPPAPVTGSQAYERAEAEPAAAAGEVAPAAEGSPRKLDHPQMTAAGPGGPVERIVMSRDGSEGWAVGGGAVFHYDGSRWRPCLAAPGAADPPAPRPDPVCESTRGLPLGNAIPVRVPLENDADPSNDEDFELVAVVNQPPAATILRYRGGRWARERPEALRSMGGKFPSQVVDVAFTAPDDGLILGARPRGESGSYGTLDPYRIYRFDGTEWKDCSATCDPAGRMPKGFKYGRLIGLVAAGDRIYAYGHRLLDGTAQDPLEADKQDQTPPRNLVWLAWSLGWGVPSGYATLLRGGTPFPLVLFKERGEHAFQGQPRAGEVDPAFGEREGTAAPGEAGMVHGLAVHERAGGYEGWATGVFGLPPLGTRSTADRVLPDPRSPLMRLSRSGEWSRWDDAGPVRNWAAGYYTPTPLHPGQGTTNRFQLALAASEAGRGIPAAIVGQDHGRLFRFDAEKRQWRALALERPIAGPFSAAPAGMLGALASDGSGGFWAVAGRYFFHYTDRPREPQFEEVAQPARDPARAARLLAASADGTLWATTAADVVYRYRRATGWEGIRIPGWEPSRIATNPASTHAIAAGPDGTGLVVGPAGRIARLSRTEVRLDRATGRLCDLTAPVAPCGTSRDLHSAAVAPDGSALVGGDRVALLWRPPFGDFMAVDRPAVSPNTRITSISMPTPDRAWLGTDRGLVFAGRMIHPGRWIWDEENIDELGELISIGDDVAAVAVRADGSGYAVGRGGALERHEPQDGEPAWRHVPGLGRDLRSFALPAAGGRGALIGRGDGEILTLVDGRFETARPAPFPSAVEGPVSSLALVPGVGEGQVEAWASVEGGHRSGLPLAGPPAPQRLLHHRSHPEPLLHPSGRVRALPDAPAPREGEIAFAAFGKSDCAANTGMRCYEMTGTTEYSEVVARRVVEEIIARADRGDGLRFAVSTGDAVDDAGFPGNQAVRNGVGRSGDQEVHDMATGPASAYGPAKLRGWNNFVADGLGDRGVPLLGAIGGQDLSSTTICRQWDSCDSRRDQARAGENTAWRRAMGSRAAPWGAAPAAGTSELAFEPVPGSRREQRTADTEISDPDGDGAASEVVVHTGGASTHYAADLVDRRSGQRRARLVFADNSLLSLAASDPQQQPREPDGGQAAWLEGMLCFEGESSGSETPCTRERGQQAIVVANAPTYSYGPGSGIHTATDGAAFESVLMRRRANVVVSGRVGWNGLYWALAPGLHEPCPGGAYPTRPPDPGAPNCGRGEATAGAETVARALRSTGPPVVPAMSEAGADLVPGGPLPFVVASGAGGKLAGGSDGHASEGFWHGYSIVRLDASGDPRKTIVEQRPVYDWIGIEGRVRTLRPGQRLTLRGFGRGPTGVRNNGAGGVGPAPINFDPIDGPAVTHRYDLLAAHPEKPYLPRTDADGRYVMLDPSVATVDDQTGQVRAGRGNYPRTFALAVLSVGQKAASYPLVLEPRRSFAPPRSPRLAVPQAPQVKVLGFGAQAFDTPPTPPAPAGSPAVETSLTMPPMPAIPGFPGAAASPITPPAPPAPPPPPASHQGTPVNLAVNPVGITVPPMPGVTSQPVPPVQPAPPSGARREAKQRQAATAKSEEGAASEQAKDAAGDLAPGRPTDANAMTRRARDPQASAWVTGLQWTGGISVAALALALGFTTLRPTPRGCRRDDVTPAPAWARRRR